MKRISTWLGITLAISAGMGGAIATSGRAVELENGTVYFVQPPRLVEATTTQNGTYSWGATYYFTLSVPENAGEPLQSITIHQQDGVDILRFDLDESRAFEGTRKERGQLVNIGEINADRKARTVSLTFDPPVAPGKLVTVGLSPVRNPNTGGVYLFGVTAFPSGEKAHGQFLGYGRLHFYDSNDSSSLFFGHGWWR